MRVEANLREVSMADVGPTAKLAEDLGVDGIAHSEVRRDPFFGLTLAAVATERVRLTPAVAIVFPRSPMITANAAHHVHELSQGRFVLGMGTQVKGHIERRFSTEWGSPGPRLREYILALRAIWDTYQNGTRLNFEGQFYTFTLMNPEFNLGPSDYFPIPIQIAAINPYLTRTAGELCDGLRTHGFTTPGYLEAVTWPTVARGAAKSGRSLETFEMVGGGFIATGHDEEALTHAREHIRYRVAWYASTPSYLPVLEHHGWEAINPDLRQLVRESRWDDMSALISDDILDVFCVSGLYSDLPEKINARIGGLTDTIMLPLPDDAENHREELQDLVRRLKQVPGADERRKALDAANAEKAATAAAATPGADA